MNWREWIYSRLVNDQDLTRIVPIPSIYGAGSIGDRPEGKPFIVIRMSPTQVNRFSSVHNVTLWVHDEAGDYALIDQVIDLCKAALNRVLPKQPGGIVVEWTGDSTDLADDGYGTITRNSSYRLITSEDFG